MRYFISRLGCLALLTLLGMGCGPDTSTTARQGIITMGPHLTETVFALGKGDDVIAVGRFDDYPPEIEALPKAGGYIDPDLEKITMLQPGLLILPGAQPELTDFAVQQGFKVLNVHMDNFATITAGVTTLGDALGCSDVAKELVTRFNAERDALEERLKTVQRPRVLIITTRESHDLNSLYTVGGTSFVSEIVSLAGGDNVFQSETQPYFEASKESVVAAAPEVIIEFHAGSDLTKEEAQAFKDDWNVLATLPAVKTGRIVLVTPSHALRPGPRIVEIAESMAAELHP